MDEQKKITIEIATLRKILRGFLNGEHYCRRTWSAWQAGTMTEDDFEPIDADDIADSIIKWRI